ncbi:MAG: PD-(D/E)XK nuclease family protein [Acutalibacter sp.]
MGKKLSELALLYDTYNGLVEASYLDSRDDLTRLAQALEGSAFFQGCTVAVDSFEGFTAQELKVLVQILRQADQVVVALCTDGLDTTGTGLFALVDRTLHRLSAAARENGVAIQPPVVLTGAPRFQNENLKLVEAQLFCAQETLTSPDCQGITVLEAKDPYEEAEFAAATIRRLVAEEGYRYREISIICRDPARYYGCLDVALKKRDIPCFVSQPAKVDGEPVTRFVLGAFQAVQGGYQTEDLLELLKTGVSGFTAEEIASLENYAYLWKLSGPGWRQEFTRHPRGFGQELTPEDQGELARLNGLRQRLMGPLERFAARTREATGGEISQAVYLLLLAFNLEETLPAYCLFLESTGEDALAQKQLRVWDLLMETLDQMRAILGDRPLSRERYAQLLKEVIAGEDVSEIPQTVDQVLFGTAEQVRQSAPRAVFLLGCAQGEFPLSPRSSGVFSDAERKELIARQLPLGDPLEQKTMEERYLAYSVACAPSQRLYASWPRCADGEDKEPSELITALLGIFPTLRPLRDLPDEYFANSQEAAFSRMAARFTAGDSASAALRQLFVGEPAYQGRVEALERAAGQRQQRVEDPALARGLFGERPFLSPTQVEVYHQCPFQYFCRYGLGAKERRHAEVDVLQYGTLMHYLFEKIFREPAQQRAQWTPQQLEERVAALVEGYARENLGGLELLSGREKYRLSRLVQSACKLIRHVEEELAQSRFVPELEWGLGAGRDARRCASPRPRAPSPWGHHRPGGCVHQPQRRAVRACH